MRSLGICIDSDSINSVSRSRKEPIDRLLLYHNNKTNYYDFVRSSYNSSPNIVSDIPEIKYSSSKADQRRVDVIGKNALRKSRLSDGERNFLFSIYNYSGLSNTLNIMETRDSIKDKLFVTENEDFLSRRYSSNQNVSVESFFPGIRLVNLMDCLDIMDLFTKTHNMYLRSPNAKMDKGFWYWCYFRWKVPHYNVPIPKSGSLTSKNDILNAFERRTRYLLIAVDELGKLHHFSSDDEIMILYHFNYILALITGVFDNLAIHADEKYGIKFPYNRISLRNNGGKEFLKELENHNVALRNHIRNNNDFITLIHILRDKVIHAEGLRDIGVFFDGKISTFISINSNDEGMIRSCGDVSGPYKKLTKWGVYKRVVSNTNVKDFFLVPYYFARSATRLLLKFADEYLELVGHRKFLDSLNPNDDYSQLMNEFQQLSLRGVER